MHAFPEGIAFCYEWRSYQKKILMQLDDHIKDRHLHLVAPPGSGKTVLGLEVMLRLNGPTFIVAPTLAIRNQWVERFVELFLQENSWPDWISTDVRKPAFMTITTYQSLHSLYHGKKYEQDFQDGEEVDDQEENEDLEIQSDNEQVFQLINQIGFKTLILDEAHHLRTAWWKSTIKFRSQLEKPAVVALTATPPYDVSVNEWQKYVDLCGPIDAEINVPELVRAKELCPHQDYVYTSVPSLEESKPINSYREEVLAFQREIIYNQSLIQLLENHPWFSFSDKYMEEMLAQPAYFSSTMIFLKAAGSSAWERPFQIIDSKEKDLPALDLVWLEEMLTGILFRDEHVDSKNTSLREIHKRLSRIGAIERKKVLLRSTSAIKRTLVNSSSKLDSINEIVSFEEKVLKDDLRLVVLADYIRMVDMPKNAGDEKQLVRLGVVPIFEKIRRELKDRVKIGVLTGSIVIVPAGSLDLLTKCAKEQGVTLKTKSLAHDASYITVEINNASKQRMVSVMTQLFSLGGVQVLIGTTALLGEGWDAPSINSLIVASYVGTFMLSNQMRGRAIRTELGNPNKTATIWHLVCIDPKGNDGGEDLESLARRFRSLMGLGAYGEQIKTGIERMKLYPAPYTEHSISKQNEEMFERAKNREGLFSRWKSAVVKDGEKREELNSNEKSVPRPFVFRNTLKGLLILGVLLGASVFSEMLEYFYYYDDNSFFLWVAFGLGVIFAAPPLLKALRLYLRNPSIESSMRHVGEAVYNSLYHTGLIQTELKDNLIHAEQDELGHITCWIENGTTHEKKIFLKALQEIVDPIENPRYLVFRESGKRFFSRYDYHAVPEELARRKGYAEFFLKEWKKQLGKAELIYTRTPEGRKELLNARIKAMSAAFVSKSDRISVWR